MKKVFFLLPFLLAITLFSCKRGSASYTPYVQVSYFYLNPVYSGDSIVGAQDTLQLHVVDDYYVLDTITLQDTVVYAAGFGSLGNDLVAARVCFDTTQLNMCAKLSSDFNKVLLPTSDVRNLQFCINPGFNLMVLPLGYRPLQSGSHTFHLMVESDSKFSPALVTFYQPVR